jgi:hypothetical protein
METHHPAVVYPVVHSHCLHAVRLPVYGFTGAKKCTAREGRVITATLGHLVGVYWVRVTAETGRGAVEDDVEAVRACAYERVVVRRLLGSGGCQLCRSGSYQ